ncbi:MAG: EamA family transporter [Chloroflexota bacterium]
MNRLFITAIAPLLWGTTYIVTTEFLADYGPLTVGVLRALPVGLAILLIYQTLPSGSWWWRSFLLGFLNIGLFFGLLFFATFRLPGGLVATIGAIQPLVVIMISWFWLNQRPGLVTLFASLVGIMGVGLLVLGPITALDLAGILAAFAAAFSMAAGVVLTKHWGRPVPLIEFTGWQLISGGLVLIPAAYFFEADSWLLPSLRNVTGFAWLAILNTGVGYFLWFRGIEKLQSWEVSFLGLLSPIVAVSAGYVILGQTFSAVQGFGILLIFAGIVGSQAFKDGLSLKQLNSALPVALRERDRFGPHRPHTCDK